MKLRRAAHRPVLDGRHPVRRVVDTGKGDAAELCVQLLQTFPQTAEKVDAPRLVVLEGQAQAFDWLATPRFQFLLIGLVEQLVLPRGMAEEPADPVIRPTTRHSSGSRCPSWHPPSRGGP